ncbi:peptidoglycan-binding protein, partial [Clostridium perfringens]|nr:peptidoglycan-binding protein [Clostridium perfringens]
MQDGFLTVSVINFSTNKPIKDATINIYGMDDEQNNTGTIFENLKTDISGQVRNLILSAPNIEYSLQPSNVKPYSEYMVEVIADGFETVLIKGTQILPVVEALQNVPVGAPTRKS